MSQYNGIGNEQIALNISENILSKEPYANKSRTKLIKQLIRLTAEYTKTLHRLGIAKTKQELLNADIIDIRGLYPGSSDFDLKIPLTTEDEKAYINDTGWVVFIPCFAEGVIHLTDNRYWDYKIMEMDSDQQMYRVLIREYLNVNNVWEMSVTAFARIYFSDMTQCTDKVHIEFTIDENDKYCSVDHKMLYSALSRKKLKWSKDDYRLWKDIIIPYADKITKDFKSKNKTAYGELTRLFVNIIMHINYTMHMNKMSRPQKPTHHKTVTADTKIVVNKQSQPERLTRTVGGIVIKSEKPARVPTEKSIIRYTMASWNTRGFIRHYKSGKTVYVKPSVHHRHCLNDNETDNRPKQTIIVKHNEVTENADT